MRGYPVIASLGIMALGLCSPVWADDKPQEDSFFEAGKAQLQKMLNAFSGAWVDSAGRAATPPTTAPRGKDASDPAAYGRAPSTDPSAPPQEAVDPSQIAQNGTVVKPENPEKRPPEGPSDSRPAPKSGASQRLPYWMPYCFLVDPVHDPNTINKNIKQLVDEYGKCGIAVEPFAFTIQPGYPTGDIPALNDLARQACDFNTHFGVRGAIQMAVSDNGLPERMCNEPGAKGCSTLCERLSISYLAPGAAAQTAVHESLHSNCCGRICVNQGQGTEDAGYGIQLVKRSASVSWVQAEPAARPNQADAQEAGQGLPGAACDSLTAGASPNDGTHRWDPNKLNFYARATDPKAQKPLDGTSFFKPKPRHPPPPGQGRGAPDDANGSRGRVTFDDSAPKVSAKDLNRGKETASADTDGRHQNGAQVDPTVQGLLNNLKDVEADPSIGTQFTKPMAAAAPTGGGSNGGGRVTFDDNASKVSKSVVAGGGSNRSGSSRSPTSFVAGAVPGTGGGLSGSGDGGGGGGGTNINGASGVGGGALDGGLFDQIKDRVGQVDEVRRRGDTLRSKDLAAIKRESKTGFGQRTDVLFSSRPDPGRIAGEQAPTPGTY